MTTEREAVVRERAAYNEGYADGLGDRGVRGALGSAPADVRYPLTTNSHVLGRAPVPQPVIAILCGAALGIIVAGILGVLFS